MGNDSIRMGLLAVLVMHYFTFIYFAELHSWRDIVH